MDRQLRVTIVDLLVDYERKSAEEARSGNTAGASFWRGTAFGIRRTVALAYGDAACEEVLRLVLDAQVAANKAAVPS